MSNNLDQSVPFISRLLHLGESGNWGNCGPDCTALARLEKCLIDNMMPLTLPLDVLDDMMPLYDSEKCYSLFEQGPCNDGEWFVLNSAIDGTLLPYAKCEKVLDCDVFTLEEDFEGKNIFCANFLIGNYV